MCQVYCCRYLVSEFFSKCISCRENWPKLMDMTHILQDSGEHDTNFVFGNVSWILVSHISGNHTDEKNPVFPNWHYIFLFSIKVSLFCSQMLPKSHNVFGFPRPTNLFFGKCKGKNYDPLVIQEHDIFSSMKTMTFLLKVHYRLLIIYWFCFLSWISCRVMRNKTLVYD